MIKKLVRISEVYPLEEYKCRLVFEDGVQKDVDIEPYLHGPIFDPILQDPKVFRSVQVIDGTLGWENGADIDPDVLYYDLKPAWMEESITS